MRIFRQSKGINRRSIIALCLAFALTLSLLPHTFGIINETPSETSPYVTVTAVGVDSSFVEVGLNIRSQSNGFRSVGAVLTYDSALLTPVSWTGTAKELPSQPDSASYTEETAREHWNAAAALDTKGPDELSGKTALAYTRGDVGYLYLSAEAPKLMEAWNEALPEIEALTEGTTTDEGTVVDESTETDTGDGTDTGTDGGEEETTPEVTGTPVTTANGVPVFVPTASPLETRIEQSVVVRFKLSGSDMDAALASIDLAAGAAAKGSPVYDESGVAYFHNDRGESIAVNVQILRAAVGTTYFTGGTGGGGGSTEGIIPITFFDWDGELLGTEIVAAADGLEAQTEAVQKVLDAFELANLPEGYTKGEDGLYSLNGEELNREGHKLSEKMGYSFGCWIPYDSETPTQYGNYVNTANVNNMAAEPLPKPADMMDAAAIAKEITDGAASLTVKAVYVDNSNCITGGNGAAAAAGRRYTVTFDNFSRFVAAGFNFPVTVKIERGNVPRAVSPALRVAITVEGVTTYSLYELKGADTEYVTVSLFAHTNGSMVDSAVFALIDQYGTNNWVGAGARNDDKALTLSGGTILSGPMGTAANTLHFSADSFARLGIIGSFNECFENYASDETQNKNTVFNRITLGTIRQAGIPAPASPNQGVQRDNLYAAWKAKNTNEDGSLKPSEEYTDLTWEEIYEIVTGSPYEG